MSGLPALSRPVEIAAIDAGGLVRTIEASESERAALAAAFGLVEIGGLSAAVTLTRGKTGVIHLEGRVSADIVQNCVVSLEPVAQTIDEPISVDLVQAAPHRVASDRAGAEIRIDVAEPDPPEVVAGPVIDLGPIVVEHFVLAIDPYPRAPAAELPDNPARDFPEAGDSPFAVLGALRQPAGKGD